MSQMSSRAGLVALALAAACLATAPLATAGVADDEATVSGHIRDARTGAAIAGARVACGERSTTTSGDGAFSLSLPRGEASLEVTAAGYTSKAVAIVAGAGHGVSVALAPALRFQERMDVEASGQSTTAPSPLAVRPVQVLAAAGAVDNVFRVLQFLPGVTGTDEFTSRLSVRGGGPDENLTVMDGVEIANPYRLQGLVSAFNPETIESFSLDTGSFGVARGDRLSSLLVVQNRAGTEAKAVAGSTALSITDANVVLEGRLPRTRGSWLVTGRRTYYDLVVGRFIDADLPSFTDLQAKLVWEPTRATRLSVFGVRSREHADADFDDDASDDHAQYLAASRNDLVAMTLDTRLGEHANGRTIVSWYDNTGSFDMSGEFQDTTVRSNAPDDSGFGEAAFSFGYDLSVRDLAFRQELFFRPCARHLLQAGAETHRLKTSIAWVVELSGDVWGALPYVLDSSVASGRSAAWLQDRVTLGRRLAVEAGLRFDHSEVNGRSDWSPRLAATLNLNDATRLRGALGKYTQSPGYDKLVQSDSFVDLSNTGRLELPNERSLHASLAFERDLGPGTEARAEVYYKSFRDLTVGRLETETERAARVAEYDFPPELTQDIPATAQITGTPVGEGRGQAYGFDLYLAKRPLPSGSRLAGWLSYTYGVASRDTYGRRYAFDYDRRHALSAVAVLRVTSWMDAAATLRVASGFPATPAVGIRVAPTTDLLDQDGDGNTTELVPERDLMGNLRYTIDWGDLSNLNTARLPLFARLDMRLSFRPGGADARWLLYLDVINVLNRKNVGSLAQELAHDPGSDRPMLVDREGGTLPIFPSFGVRFRF